MLAKPNDQWVHLCGFEVEPSRELETEMAVFSSVSDGDSFNINEAITHQAPLRSFYFNILYVTNPIHLL